MDHQAYNDDLEKTMNASNRDDSSSSGSLGLDDHIVGSGSDDGDGEECTPVPPSTGRSSHQSRNSTPPVPKSTGRSSQLSRDSILACKQQPTQKMSGMLGQLTRNVELFQNPRARRVSATKSERNLEIY